jgi:hypothetical protein
VPRVSLFGVPVAWTLEGRAPDPLEELFEMLDLSAQSAPEEPARVHFLLRPASPATSADPAAAGYRPAFYQGIVRAYREPASLNSPAFLLWDQASRVRVPLDGSPIDAEIAPEAREITPGSTLTLLEIALALALRREGLFHLHAAAVVHPSGAGVLIAGGSGAGKTTTALALLEAGFAYLADDELFVRLAASPGPNTNTNTNTKNPEIFGFPRHFHLGAATLAAFPRLRPLASPSPGARGKLALDPRLAFPGKFLPKIPAPSIAIFPTIGASAKSSLEPIPLADAAGALIASSAALLIDGFPGRSENLALLPKLLPRSGAFELSLGKDALTSPALVPLVERALAHVAKS